MPRVLGAVFCGGGLALCGAVMQSLLNNPLAEPYTVGVSSGAVFGACLALIMGLSMTGIAQYGVVLNAFILALVPMTVIVLLTRYSKNLSPVTMILAGTAISYFFSGMTSVLMVMTDDDTMANAYRWQIGSLVGIHWDNLWLIAVAVTVTSLVLLSLSKYLNAMSMGNHAAASLGINIERVRTVALLATTLMAAVVLSFTGVIGFVGLVAPHIIRRFIGGDNTFVLPASILVGSTTLVLADALSRLITAVDVPVGAVMMMIGAPVFIFLMVGRRNRGGGVLNTDTRDAYRRLVRRQRLGLAVFAAATVLLAVLTFPVCDNDKVTYLDGFGTLLYHLGIGNTAPSAITDYIFWNTLLPRTVAGLLVGGLLGLVGTVMQYILSNPLADPYTTGISSGAGLGAVLMIALGVSVIPGLTGQTAVVANAFLFGIIPVAVMMAVSYFRRMTPSEIILVGLGLMFFFSAANSVVMLTADPNDMHGAYAWGLGNLGTITWDSIWMIAASSIAGSVFFLLSSEKVRVMSNTDRMVFSLGVRPHLARMVFMVVVSLTVAGVVCFTGTIGFVGIVAPHVVRLTLGSDIRFLMPASFFAGAAMLMMADAVARMVALPVGVITSILGGAIFFAILVKQRRAETEGM